MVLRRLVVGLIVVLGIGIGWVAEGCTAPTVNVQLPTAWYAQQPDAVVFMKWTQPASSTGGPISGAITMSAAAHGSLNGKIDTTTRAFTGTVDSSGIVLNFAQPFGSAWIHREDSAVMVWRFGADGL